MSHIQCIFDLDSDVMGLVLHQLARCKYSKVMEEFQLPLLRNAYKRLVKDWKGYTFDESYAHPGRFLVRVIHPQWRGCMPKLEAVRNRQMTPFQFVWGS